MLLLPMVLGCHPASETVHAVQDLSDIMELEITARIDPEITDAQSACVDQHDVHACTRVAEYWEGENGHPFDPKKAFQFASRGCGGGDGLACAILGKHYQNGLGTMWSPRYAIRIYEQSCNAGTGLGCAGLGEMYARGYGVIVDRAKAKSYFDSRARAVAGGMPGERTTLVHLRRGVGIGARGQADRARALSARMRPPYRARLHPRAPRSAHAS